MTLPETKFQDLVIGQVFETETFELSLEEIRSFASQYDPQPIHLDPVASAAGPFGQLTASGWHTLSLTMKLMAEAKPFGETPLIGVGVDGIEFRKPVFPGTRIRVVARIVSKRGSTKPGRGFVVLDVETLNADSGEPVIRQQWSVLVPAD